MLRSSYDRRKTWNCPWIYCSIQIVNSNPAWEGLCLLTTYRPFDKNKLSTMFYLLPDHPDLVRMLCRWVDPYANPLTAAYGVHELCVHRKGSSLQIRRWSLDKLHPTLFAALFFKTYESKSLSLQFLSSWRARGLIIA